MVLGPDCTGNGPICWGSALCDLGHLVEAGGVYLDERRISDPQEEVELAPGMLLRVGKRRVARLV
jgi:hypothetical protein